MALRFYSNSVFKDKRLEYRFSKVCERLSESLSTSVAQAATTWGETKAIYRFWDNRRVTPERQLAFHYKKLEGCLNSACNTGFILQLSDSVELDFTGKRCGKLLGPLSFVRQRGLILHNSLLVSSSGCPLGLLKQSFLQRRDEDFGKKRQRASAPMETKESSRWLRHLQAGEEFCRQNPTLTCVYVADREADIMQLLAHTRVTNMHFVIRSHYNRSLCQEAGQLRDAVDKTPVAGTYRLMLRCSPKRSARKTTLQLRFCSVCVAAPKPGQAPVSLYVVDVQEINPYIKGDELVHWRLLTTLPLENFQQALQIVRFYSLRWLIERFHFALKSGGAQVEELQLATPQRLKNAITSYSIASMEALSLRYWAEKTPQADVYSIGVTPLECEVLFIYAQKRLKLKTAFDPQKPPNVQQYCILLGQITGFFPSKRQPIPGVKILARSLEKLQVLVDAYVTFFQ